MMKFAFAALAVLGIALGTASLSTSAYAYTQVFPPNGENQGANS
jgi:hypothetical protein